jgi:hypothetical protein
LFTEDYSAGVDALGQRLGLRLEARHERVTGQRTPLSPDEYDRLRQMLEPEYELLRQLRAAGIGGGAKGAVPGPQAGAQTPADGE